MRYTTLDFDAGETIFVEGDGGDHMFLVQDGSVEILQTVGDHENQLSVLERGDFFGEMAVLENLPRTHGARALTKSKLVELDLHGLARILGRNSEIGVRMMRKLARRVYATEDMLWRTWSGAESESEGLTRMVAGGRARLVFVTTGAEMALPDAPEARVGRLDPHNEIYPDIDLTAIDPQLSTSRSHAKILRRATAFFVQEESATNGTFLNGQRVSAKTPVEIRDGDEIMFGAVRMRFAVD